MTTIDRAAYAQMFGPTTGDRVRLGDTALWIEVERDFTVYGDEVKFGGGKVIRDGMGQSQRLSAENEQPEIFKWTDTGDSFVTCTFQSGKLKAWELTRPSVSDTEESPQTN